MLVSGTGSLVIKTNFSLILCNGGRGSTNE
nr:MAG TPA: Erythromycin resistance leader peptide [Caudoviricetes sp.]